ncbi:reducing type I polyketide synthase [Zopfia rhizophila CBS 207.26]|uniref:Reducing type I polyketide synthase n=1 Tax=Zopfia rhizophila CBS 207.26 TaxID=1314779 RepID=A0A6A6DRC4_9PEZI|nr:reducing type I polyketide synthase [Zopfia rhizophila CBS 207.26]
MSPHENLFEGYDITGSHVHNVNVTPTHCQPKNVNIGNSPEPIAIVGLSFLFPGDAADTSESLWKVLLEGRSTATEFPENRLRSEGIYHPNRDRRGTIPFRGGHFLKGDVAKFDAPFFSISDTEAASLDPQQRGLLETTYRALENAGQPLNKVVGSKTSVYTGCFTSDWKLLTLKDAETCADHSATGFEDSMIANRISWFFNFTGNSFNVDSACSSSLVSLDLACQSLLSGDADMSIAAGCNLILSPDTLHAFAHLGLLSSQNQCFSFDKRGNGYVRGEGFSVLVLKRLSDALKNNDVIRAVIRATGSNHDGYTPGISQPNGQAQVRLIRGVYAKACLPLSETKFVEAHGTGTATGDPIEANSIGEAFRESRSDSDPLYVGALKSNIGHLEGASGIAGVIKTILVLEKGVIPPNANFTEVNPRIDPDWLRIKFPLESIAWPSKGLRRASVNSFGFGGTNAHVILDDALHYLRAHGLTGAHNTVEYPSEIEPTTLAPQLLTNGCNVETTSESWSASESKLLILSAMDEDTLKRNAKDHAHALSAMASKVSAYDSFANDLAYTLNSRRTLLPWRSSMIIESIDDIARLDSKMSPPCRSISKPSLCFVFTGQGAQYAGDKFRYLEKFSVFRRRLLEAEEFLLELGCPWRLREELFKDAENSNINRPDYAQPISTAIQVALVDLMRSLDVHPTAVVGHSSGEVAAAYAIGALSAQSAWKITFYRGMYSAQLAASKQAGGSMMAVGLSEAEIQPYIDQLSGEFNTDAITVACINSPKSITLSGDTACIVRIGRELKEQGIFARKLLVDLAYHTPALNQVADQYSTSVGTVQLGEPPSRPVTMISSVTGKPISEDQLCTAQYWILNMISPVRFSAAISGLDFRSGQTLRNGAQNSRYNPKITSILEIGFHSTLKGPIRDTLNELPGGTNVVYTSALVRNQRPVNAIYTALGQLYCHGYNLNLDKANFLGKGFAIKPKLLHNLPQYQFNHSKTYWQESRISRKMRLARQPKLDLLGKQTPDWNPLEGRWRNFIKVSEMPWVADHKVNGTLLYPGAGMLVMAIEAANQMADTQRMVSGFTFKDVLFLKPLNIPLDAKGIETNVSLRQIPDSNSTSFWLDFRVFSFEMDEWHENCRGSICVEYDASSRGKPPSIDSEIQRLEDLRMHRDRYEKCSIQGTFFNGDHLYPSLWNSGFEFGPSFRRIHSGSYNGNSESTGNIELYAWPEDEYPQPHIIHPCSLDGILHSSFAAYAEGGSKSVPTAVPSGIRKLYISKVGMAQPESTEVKASTWMTSSDSRGGEYDISVLDSSMSKVLAVAEGLRFTIVAEGQESESESTKQTCYHLEWKPDMSLLNPSQISEYCAQARLRDPEPVAFYQDLVFVLLGFLFRAVKEVGDEVCPNPPHLSKYIDWARMQLDRFQKEELPHAKPEWKHLFDVEEVFGQVCQSVESYSDYGRVFVTIGRKLISILKGEVDALQFYFENNLLKAIYRDLNGSRTCIPEFNLYLDALSHKNPSLKILEIGAGTGGTTEKILSHLSGENTNGRHGYSNYHYTDISPAFFEQAREDFAQYPNIAFKTLDIELDPLDQGYDPESFDLVIASNVLHATRDMTRTMAHVRSLLKPGGTLMITGFITGLLPGWWLGNEPERFWAPTLNCEEWNNVLHNNHFSGIDLELPEYISSECYEAGILVTTATTKTPQETPKDKVIVVVANLEFSTHQELLQRLETKLCNEQASECRVAVWQDLGEVTDSAECHFVFIDKGANFMTASLSESIYSSLNTIATSCKGLLFVSDGGGSSPSRPEAGSINGLFRVLRNENPQRPCAILALSIHTTITDDQIGMICKVFRETQHVAEPSKCDMEYMEIQGRLNIPRVVATRRQTEAITRKSQSFQRSMNVFSECPPLKLGIESIGFLDSLHFKENYAEETCRLLDDDEIEIEVRAIGMNFRDCLAALGRVPTIAKDLGSECAGIVTRAGCASGLKPGARAVTLQGGAFKTFARAKASNAVAISEEMSFAEAASIPTQFATAWQALYEAARLRKGESILIHAGAGGTGQAAIQVAQYIGAKVFATVGSGTKKDVLIDEYGIPENQIFYSRTTEFSKSIIRATKGRGVDVVLNSLAGDSLVAGWECIAPYGRFIEIGKQDILTNSKLPMYAFKNNTSFICFDGATWQQERPHEIRTVLKKVFGLFDKGKLHVARPLHVLDIGDVEKAFRMMQEGRSSGKIVLEVKPESKVKTILPTRPGFRIDEDSTCIVSGGLGGLGRNISRWLADHGAKNLILLSRSGAKSGSARKLLQELQEKGVNVVAPSCDITDKASLQDVLRRCCSEMPPIKGCIQSAMVLRDAIFDRMSHEDWRLGTECKIQGSWNLHELLPKDLDFFIMLSSASGIVGLRGQANYAAGNTYLDALARYRVSQAQRAVSLDLGALIEDGMVAENPEFLNRVLSYGALAPITRQQFAAILDYYCDPALELSQQNCQAIIGLGKGIGPGLDGMDISQLAIFSHLKSNDGNGIAHSDGHAVQADWKEKLALSSSFDDAASIISQCLIEKLQKTLSTLQSTVHLDVPLATFGVDSLLAVELRTWIGKEVLSDVATFEILGAANFGILGRLIAGRSKVKHPAWEA